MSNGEFLCGNYCVFFGGELAQLHRDFKVSIKLSMAATTCSKQLGSSTSMVLMEYFITVMIV